MKNRILLDRIIQTMTDKEISLERQMKTHKATTVMLKEATDIVGEKPAIESQETSQDTTETIPETPQEADIEAEDNQKEAVALKTEEGIMKMIEIGRLTMARAGIERVARSP